MLVTTIFSFSLVCNSYLLSTYYVSRGFPGGTVIKNQLASAGDARETGSIPGSGRSSREGSGNPLQCSCLENSIDNRGVTKNWTRLSTNALHVKSFSCHWSEQDRKSSCPGGSYMLWDRWKRKQ